MSISLIDLFDVIGPWPFDSP